MRLQAKFLILTLILMFMIFSCGDSLSPTEVYIKVTKGSSTGDPGYSRSSSVVTIRLQLQNDSADTADELDLEFAIEFSTDPNSVYYITDHYIKQLKAGVKKDYVGYFYETDSSFHGNPFVSLTLWKLSTIKFYNYSQDTVKPVYDIPYSGAAYTLFSK